MPTTLFMNEQPAGEWLQLPMPIRLVPQQELAPGAARVFTVETIDSTHIRVTFFRPLVNNAAANCGEIWNVITTTLGARNIFVRGMVLESAPNVAVTPGQAIASILFTVDEMLNFGAYAFEIIELREA